MSISSKATGLRPGVCTSTTRPTSPYTGQLIFQTDTGTMHNWDGTTWQFLAPTQQRNILYNGAMQVAQRGTSTASITASGYYTADRWKADFATMGTWTQSVENDAPTGSGFRKSLKMLCTAADASPAAGDAVSIQQLLEGQDVQAFRKGTSSAQQFTVSFWVKANVTGTYICELYDGDSNRQVSKAYTISSSGTWEFKTLTFGADTTGAFDNDNNVSLYAVWWLGAGSNFTSGTLNTSWAAATNANRVVGQTNVAAATNNYWQVTGVQLNVGGVAAPFEFKSYGQEFRECQRYYQRYTSTAGDQAFAAGVFLSSTQPLGAFTFPVMRSAPTFSFTAGTYDVVTNGAALSVSSMAAGNVTTFSAQLSGTCSGATAGGGCVYRQDSGYFELTGAEL